MEVNSRSISDREKECDVVIVFHEKDQFIENELYSILKENKISFSYIDRDGHPGRTMLDNYSKLIHLSRKVLFIVSQVFLESTELQLVVEEALLSHNKTDVISLITDGCLTFQSQLKHTQIVHKSESMWKNEIVNHIKTSFPDFMCLLENGRASDLLLMRGLCFQNFRFDVFGLLINCRDMCLQVDITQYLKHISKHNELRVSEICNQCSWLFRRNTTLCLAFNSKTSSLNCLQDIEENLSKLILGAMDPLEGNDLDHTPTWDLGCIVTGEYKNEHQQYISTLHRKVQFLLKNRTISRQEQPCYPAYEEFEARLRSFDSIKEETIPIPEEMANAGFFLFPGNMAKCYFCGYTFFNWIGQYDPFVAHSKQRPQCSFVQSRMYRDELRVAEEVTINATKRRDLESVHTRIETLKKLDLTKLTENLSEEEKESLLYEIADAGFYHVENMTIECFSCRTAIYYNKIDVDPWILHASLSAKCEYLCKQKGDDFVKAIQSGMKRGGSGQTIVTFLLKMLTTSHRADWDDYIFFPRATHFGKT